MDFVLNINSHKWGGGLGLIKRFLMNIEANDGYGRSWVKLKIMSS